MSNYNTCFICKKHFGGRKKKYCSQDCADEARRRRNKNRYRKEVGFDLEHKANCLYCGADISEQKIGTMYCSKQCRENYRYYQSTEQEVQRLQLYKQIIKIIKDNLNSKIKQQEEEQKQLLKKIKEKEREEKRREEEKRKILEGTRKCVICGREFYHQRSKVKTCSKKCSKKNKNRIIRLLNSKRLTEENVIDRDISLERLYTRDKGVCHICGGHCDYDDITITQEGWYIVGKNYPSIDHVKPLSKEGEHSWGNVKLAHHYCNSLKSDAI